MFSGRVVILSIVRGRGLSRYQERGHIFASYEVVAE